MGKLTLLRRAMAAEGIPYDHGAVVVGRKFEAGVKEVSPAHTFVHRHRHHQPATVRTTSHLVGQISKGV